MKSHKIADSRELRKPDRHVRADAISECGIEEHGCKSACEWDAESIAPTTMISRESRGSISTAAGTVRMNRGIYYQKY